MNGRANSKELISDETDIATGKREVWYRIQASLYSEPRFKDYPFDTQIRSRRDWGLEPAR
jgi:hypothetical protein